MKDPGRGPVRASTARRTAPCFGGVWVGVERGGWGSDLGGLAHCWALRDQPVWLVARGLLRPLSRCFGVVVVGGCVV